MNLFDSNSLIMKLFNLLADILLLHILWLVYSLPIITIGASTTALYYAMMKRIRTDEGNIIPNFHGSFKSNFRQATIIWIILATFFIVFFLDIRFCLALNNNFSKIMLFGCSLFFLPFLLICFYIFPVQAKFENRIFDNFKNAFFMAFVHFPYTLLLIFLTATVILFAFRYRLLMGFFIICGMGFYSYITSGVYIQVFRKYIPNEAEEDLEKSGRTLYFDQ